MFNELRWEVIVRFVNIGGIVDHHYLNFHFIRRTYPKLCWGSNYMGVMVFNATFNNISAISWRSVLLEKTLTCRKSLTNLINFSCDAWTLITQVTIKTFKLLITFSITRYMNNVFTFNFLHAIYVYHTMVKDVEKNKYLLKQLTKHNYVSRITN
jgi:hypothetical protein